MPLHATTSKRKLRRQKENKRREIQSWVAGHHDFQHITGSRNISRRQLEDGSPFAYVADIREMSIVWHIYQTWNHAQSTHWQTPNIYILQRHYNTRKTNYPKQVRHYIYEQQEDIHNPTAPRRIWSQHRKLCSCSTLSENEMTLLFSDPHMVVINGPSSIIISFNSEKQ